MTIDSATLQYKNQPITAPRAETGLVSRQSPSGAEAAQGLGGRIMPKVTIDKKSDLYAQCQEFESIFVQMMLKEMRATVNKEDTLIDGGQAEEIFDDMLYEERAKSMTKTAGFGLADSMYLELLRSNAAAIPADTINVPSVAR